ncbi:HEAT repeat domain-containing protein [Methanovulcanius yangii]|uniref:HEAT repeat domain-containing protein n=1 Tax=Methanovulcanius yangii TaxID=1789227 RepID=UPI0029CA9BE0|nr:HEAT repeat domain-containing protein [Methanovulcanius yangii]
MEIIKIAAIYLCNELTFVVMTPHGLTNVSLLEEEKNIDGLILALTDPMFPVRGDAAKALGKIGDPHAVEPLIGILTDDPKDLVRGLAAQALGQIGDSRAIGPLIASVNTDLSPFARFYSALALGEFPDDGVVVQLLEVLGGDPDNNVRIAALASLRKQTSEM